MLSSSFQIIAEQNQDPREKQAKKNYTLTSCNEEKNIFTHKNFLSAKRERSMHMQV